MDQNMNTSSLSMSAPKNKCLQMWHLTLPCLFSGSVIDALHEGQSAGTRTCAADTSEPNCASSDVSSAVEDRSFEVFVRVR